MKRILMFTLGIALIILSFGIDSMASEDVDIDTSSVEEGYVKILFDKSTDNDVIVYIKNGETSTQHELHRSSEYLGYLIPEDGGYYTVTIYEETAKDKYMKLKTDTFYLSESRINKEARRLFGARNLMSWQIESGGWGKNIKDSYYRTWNGEEKRSGFYISKIDYATIDNNATVPEVIFMIKTYLDTEDEEVQEAALSGVDFLLEMQYESGAFPQIYPLREDRSRSAYLEDGTYNDDATVMVLDFFRDVLEEREALSPLLDEAYMDAIEDALDRGIDYILKTQILVDGQLTAWCAQHDPITYEPTKARAYELISISGYESVGIIEFLISMGDEDPRIVEAVESAVAWFNQAGVANTKYDRYAKSGSYFPYSSGRTMWYRFYDIETGKGFFSDRDSRKVYEITQIGEERRHGYSWAGSWARDIIDFEYE